MFRAGFTRENRIELLLKIENLKKYYYIRKPGIFTGEPRVIKAVDDVSLRIDEGRTLGLVGESGSGKSTLGRLLLSLEEGTKGRILFNGKDISQAGNRERRYVRGQVQVVFQDPYSSLNPKIRVGKSISEPIRNQGTVKKNQIDERIAELLEKVGLRPEDADRFPLEFSGGQRQRIGIARAISTNPKFIVLDEPVSALDVSIQAQIINLLVEIQESANIAYLFIGHNIEVVEHVADKIAVMYLGKIVELLDAEKILDQSSHPYTRALINAIPVPDPNVRQDEIVLKGEISDAHNYPQGCRFHPRCPEAHKRCLIEEPEFREINDAHFAACHL
jgi:oligopeptide transport system ATP-binding protein